MSYKNAVIFIVFSILSIKGFPQSLDKLLSAPTRSAQGSVSSDALRGTDSADDELRKKISNAETIFSKNAQSSSGREESNISSKQSGQNIAIRFESYNNAGRSVDGYWVRCGTDSEQRVYRSGWDNSDWYRPGAVTPYFLAKGNLPINDLAKMICKR